LMWYLDLPKVWVASFDKSVCMKDRID
jgi:hypothetical protein